MVSTFMAARFSQRLIPSLLCEAPLTLKLITRTEQTTARPPSRQPAWILPAHERLNTRPGEKSDARGYITRLEVQTRGETLEDSGANERRSRPGNERRLAGGGARSLLAGLGGPGGRGGILRVAGRGDPVGRPRRALGLRTAGRDRSRHRPLFEVRGGRGGQEAGSREITRRGRGGASRDRGRRESLRCAGSTRTRPAHGRRPRHHRQ